MAKETLKPIGAEIAPFTYPSTLLRAQRQEGPAGLDIGAWTPQETAVSLVAEILASRGGRSGRPLSASESAIHP